MRKKNFARRTAVLFLSLLAVGTVFGAIALALLLRDLPNPAKFEERKVAESTRIYDRTGEVLLYEIHGEEKRTIIPFESIPPAVKNATIVLEDSGFYKHGGIDFRGITRAFVVDIFSRNFRQGGSTITQQLIKNSILGRERTIQRKIKEALLAILLESRYSKNEILHLYLNQIPYGSNAYGIEAASQTYFGTSTPNLSIAQAATLAALPKAPTYYLNHTNELMERKNGALAKMAEFGYLTENAAEEAKKEKINIRVGATGIRAPHFVMYVKELLAEKYGEEALEEGGLVIRTTLDWRLQEEAEKIIKEGAEFNEKAIKAYNAALTAVDPKTGDILVMVGSRDWYQAEPLPAGCAPGINCFFDPKVNVATSLRQPGSAFKPFIYLTAFKKGYTPETMLFDIPTEFNPLCSLDGGPQDPRVKTEDCYHPGNYDETFRGPVTLRKALAQSLNVPSVKTLYLAGIEGSIQNAEQAGITTLKDRSRFGLSLVLGGAEVRLLEMTSAYGALATDGLLAPHRAILKVEAEGRVLEETKTEPRQVFDTEAARIVNDVLSDDDARVGIFQPRGSLWLPDRQAAAKTGTTQEYRDAWTVGYTPSLVVGVWAGNNYPESIQQKGSGVLAAAPMWNKFMRFALKDTLPEFFTKPDYKKSPKPVINGLWQGGAVFRIDRISGKLATALTPEDTIVEVAYGEPHDPLFWIDRNDPLGTPPGNPMQDPQLVNWERSFQQWLKTSGFVARPAIQAPTEYDDIHTEKNKPKIQLAGLADEGEQYRFTLSVSGNYPIKEVNAIILDSLLASTKPDTSGIVSFTVEKTALGEVLPNIVVKAYDNVGNVGETVIPFNQPAAPN
ncbi:MAG: transglycosylase domain-containing protein [Candidatus Sungbacteria bacterium]|nr:transglycosylase domain-containing protein [Candidatus Sungbacteria bacterium]